MFYFHVAARLFGDGEATNFYRVLSFLVNSSYENFIFSLSYGYNTYLHKNNFEA